MNHIANNTKMIRSALGLTQGELAEKTGSNLKCVASYERGVSPPYEFLIALSKLSGISIHDIIVTEFNSVNLKRMEQELDATIMTPKNPVIKHGAYALTVSETGQFRMDVDGGEWKCVIPLSTLKDVIVKYGNEIDVLKQ